MIDGTAIAGGAVGATEGVTRASGGTHEPQIRAEVAADHADSRAARDMVLHCATRHNGRTDLTHSNPMNLASWIAIAAVALTASVAFADAPAGASAGSPATHGGTQASADEGAPQRLKAATGVDSLIAHLHDTFRITAAQEPLWARVATAMHENADTMSKLAKRRFEASKSATAIDDLKSYAEISSAHAEGANRLIAAFQPLYDSMSDSQKAAADTEFRDHYSGRHHR